MTTYNASAVSDATIAFQKPITLQQGRALRDNPLAIGEGAAGAPRIATQAMIAPTAGANIIARYAGAETTSFAGVEAVRFQILVAGTIRFIVGLGCSGGTASMDIYKNGVLVTTFTEATAGPVSKTIDVSVNMGDTITGILSASSTSTATASSMLVCNGTFNMAVAR